MSAVIVRILARQRGAVVGALASAIAIVLARRAHFNAVRFASRYALWFTILATALMISFTALTSLLERRLSLSLVPRAIARERTAR